MGHSVGVVTSLRCVHGQRVAEVVLKTRSVERRRLRNREIKAQGRIIFGVPEITLKYDKINIEERDTEPELKFSEPKRE